MTLMLLAQVPMPKDGDNPWVWLCGALVVALAYVTRQWVSGQSDALQRERDQNDKLVNTIPEIVTLMREWKEANNGRPPTRRS